MALVPSDAGKAGMGGGLGGLLGGMDPKSLIAMALMQKLMNANKPQEDYVNSLGGVNPYTQAINQKYGGGI